MRMWWESHLLLLCLCDHVLKQVTDTFVDHISHRRYESYYGSAALTCEWLYVVKLSNSIVPSLRPLSRHAIRRRYLAYY